MAARAAIALCLVALGWAGAARAQDEAACAQYREAMAYNLCLAQHGPRANGVGKLHGGPQPGHAAQGRVWYGQAHGARRPRASPARGARSASVAACIWSFKSAERRLRIASAAPEPAEDSAGAALFPRAVGDQREGRASHQAPWRGNAGN